MLTSLAVLLESRGAPGGDTGAGALALYVAAVAWLAGAIAWYAAVIQRGQSPGKWVVGTRIVRTDGRPAGAWFTLLRQVLVRDLLGYVASMATGGLYFVVAGGLCLVGNERQCLWDRMLGTSVVEARRQPGRSDDKGHDDDKAQRDR